MSQTSSLKFKYLAPVLIVDRIEPCRDFWINRLGFSAANEVHGDDGALMFASVVKDDIEIMYQSRASVVADNPSAADDVNPRSSVLFLTVESLDAMGAPSKARPSSSRATRRSTAARSCTSAIRRGQWSDSRSSKQRAGRGAVPCTMTA
jgi:hypothetical protein